MNAIAPLMLAAPVLYGLASVAAVQARGNAVPLWLRWPVATWDAIMRSINRAIYGPPPAPKADPLRIAVLEYELFGIEPKPGTMAAAAIRLSELGRRS